MDCREGITLPTYYHLSRGNETRGSAPLPVHGGGSSTSRIHHPNPSYKNPTNQIMPFQANAGLTEGPEISSPLPRVQSNEPMKKKRGRPRKYGPDGANMALGLSTVSSSSGLVSPGEKRRQGRPPGTGWKQKLAPLGEWMNTSAGLAFTPHVLRIGVGEDIAFKILAFAQQRPRALCIMSANGSVSSITLRQPTNTDATVTYEGRFEILCLSGSYLVTENGDRTGGISISVSSPDGHILGGALSGKLVAANPVQVIGCSFIYGNKSKNDQETPEEKRRLENFSDKSRTPTVSLNHNSDPSIWANNEARYLQQDINLTRG